MQEHCSLFGGALECVRRSRLCALLSAHGTLSFMSNTSQGARARARLEVTAAIKDAARRQLAAEGAAKLSLRAVARELGMVSSALYRYFPSRDDLLTALIIDAYDSVGEAAEAADAKARKGAHAEVRAQARAGRTADPTTTPYARGAGPAVPAAPAARAAPAAPVGPARRWVRVCEAVRAWALVHPHEYALIHGSPVPGYSAPDTTVPAAARVGKTLIGIVQDAYRGPGVAYSPLPAELRPEAERLRADLAPDLPPEVVVALVAAWAELYGLIGFELFGQFNRVLEEREIFFRHAVGRLAHDVGLVYGEAAPAPHAAAASGAARAKDRPSAGR